MTESHAIYSPSSAYRNLSCPGSLALINGLKKEGKIKDREASSYAKEGTLAHEYISAALNTIHKEMHYDFESIPDPVMSVHVRDYCAFIGEINTKFRYMCEAVQFHIEKKVKYDDDLWGTVDYMLTGFHKKSKLAYAVICDFKYGRGVEVSAEDNEQLLCYALCAEKTLKRKFALVHCFIYQPRTPGKEASRWTIDADILTTAGNGILRNKEYCMKLLQSADYTGALEAGEHCRFCPAKADGNCSQFNAYLNSSQLKVLDGVPEVPSVSTLTLEQKTEIFKLRKPIRKFLDEIEVDLLTTANSGVKVPGHKIVEGTRRRKWKEEVNPLHLTAIGVDNPIKEVLIGIGEVEKQIGKGKIDDLTELSNPSYQLVPDSDKRTEVQSISLENLEEIEFNE